MSDGYCPHGELPNPSDPCPDVLAGMLPEGPDFEGHEGRECGEHRTVGSHRAWCPDCGEWCYPELSMGCLGCEVPILRARLAAVEALRDEWVEVGVHDRSARRAAQKLSVALGAPRTTPVTSARTACKPVEGP